MRARTGSLRLFCFLLLACGGLLAQAPVLFFSDIASGPNTGGENGNGAYVTIYGNYLGASQGASTATAGGGSMGNCPVWGAAWLWYQKITCQLGPNAATGSLIVTVNGQASNPLPFTILVFLAVFAGGVIPAQDYDFLFQAGAKAIFGPGTRIEDSAKTTLIEIRKALASAAA